PTRLQLTEESGLSRKVVSQRLDELMLRGLVVEGPQLQSTGGRAPRTFQFCSTAGYLLAVQFGGTSVAVGLTDLEGSIVDEILEPAEMSETVEQRAGRVEDLIDTLLERRPECRPLRGMGVGIFASVDS